MGRKVGPTYCHIVEGITAGRKKPSEKYSTKLDTRVVAFAMRHNMRVMNTYLEKADRHNISYRSGAAEPQNYYCLHRSSDKGRAYKHHRPAAKLSLMEV